MLPEKIYVAIQTRGNDEKVGFMVIADKEETKTVQKKIESANKWAAGYYGKGYTSIYIDNKPKTGFKLVTNVSRYSTSNVVWRIKHPAGFEFEITSDNMCDLLETNTIVNGEFQDELFFTQDRKLVNQKTKLFSKMVEAQEFKDEAKEKVKNISPGTVIAFKLLGYDKVSEELLYCGKVHAICQPNNAAYNIPEKSTLCPVLKCMKTGNYYVTSAINSNFDIIQENVEFTIEEVLEGIKNTNNKRHSKYISGGPNVKLPYHVDVKPFKSDKLTVQYEQVSSISKELRSEDVYIIYDNNKKYRVMSEHNRYNNNTYRTYYVYPCEFNENGVPLMEGVDLSKINYYKDEAFEHERYHVTQNKGKPKLISINNPDVIFYGKLSY